MRNVWEKTTILYDIFDQSVRWNNGLGEDIHSRAGGARQNLFWYMIKADNILLVLKNALFMRQRAFY